MDRELLPIAVHGAPRSGTSWLGEILNSSPATCYKYQPLFSYRFKSFLTPTSTAGDIEDFFRQLATARDDFLDQTERREQGSMPTFVKGEATHLVYKEVRYHHVLPNLLARSPRLRLVAIIRDPLAVLASWMATPREFRSDLGWRPLEEWRHAPKKNLDRPEEFFGFERWKVSARTFLELERAHPRRVRVLEYDRLLRDTTPTVRSLFAFCGLEHTAQTEGFLAQSAARNVDDPYAVYRTRADARDSRQRLDPAIEAAVRQDLAHDDLERFLSPETAPRRA